MQCSYWIKLRFIYELICKQQEMRNYFSLYSFVQNIDELISAKNIIYIYSVWLFKFLLEFFLSSETRLQQSLSIFHFPTINFCSNLYLNNKMKSEKIYRRITKKYKKNKIALKTAIDAAKSIAKNCNKKVQN